jgi:hypothetical protein
MFPFQLPKQNGRLNKQNGRLLDVMFWIHGGGFYLGSANDYPPQYLMDKNVVFVSTNYRLGVLGTSHYKTSLASFNIPSSKYSFRIILLFFHHTHYCCVRSSEQKCVVCSRLIKICKFSVEKEKAWGRWRYNATHS